MPTANSGRDLVFADKHLSATLHENVSNLEVSGVVVNLSSGPIHLQGEGATTIFPWRSTMLTRRKIIRADRIAVLSVTDAENLGGVGLRGWTWFGDIYSGFPRETPLYVSAVDTVGLVEEDPLAFTRERATARPKARQPFELQLKCWWAPAQTDCFIHNEHPFLEVHTQIFGVGRMQKFQERAAETLYEDVIMSPGFTHESFCTVAGANDWVYPWHRYWTDTDSIWLAIELHPQT